MNNEDWKTVSSILRDSECAISNRIYYGDIEKAPRQTTHRHEGRLQLSESTDVGRHMISYLARDIEPLRKIIVQDHELRMDEARREYILEARFHLLSRKDVDKIFEAAARSNGSPHPARSQPSNTGLETIADLATDMKETIGELTRIVQALIEDPSSEVVEEAKDMLESVVMSQDEIASAIEAAREEFGIKARERTYRAAMHSRDFNIWDVPDPNMAPTPPRQLPSIHDVFDTELMRAMTENPEVRTSTASDSSGRSVRNPAAMVEMIKILAALSTKGK